MATSSTETPERDDTERSTTAEESSGDSSRASALPSKAVEQVKNGRLPMLVGGVMAARGVRGLLSKRGRGLAQAATGLALLGFGLRQRSKGEGGMTDIGIDFGTDVGESAEESVPGTETVALRADSNEPDRNPRDVDDEPDVATTGDADEGEVQFETDRDDVDLERKPHLDDTDPKDPRYPDEGDPETDDDDHVDVDISEPALADEPNEAVGPDEEQAYPASEGTDPEPSAPKSPEQAEGEEIEDLVDDDEESTGDESMTTADEADEDTGMGDEEANNEAAGNEETGDDEDDATADDDSDEDIEESI